MAVTRVLTGITTTGIPHLGNYVGAIRPAIAASLRPKTQSFFFLADYHALIKCDDPARIERSRQQLAATWLASGLDPERVVFYRQSDIPEIPELTWLLTCVCPKGLMNRAHAYKAATDANVAAGDDLDAGVSMGLFSYPILMAADILMFNAHEVPVGRDQVQHIEMARDLGKSFNHLFGNGQEYFTLPEAVTDEDTALLPGLDGRKMSKSYDNVIPLYEGGAKALQEAVSRIVTDSRLPGEPKEVEGSHLVALYNAFASTSEVQRYRDDLRAGLGWGEAKQRLLEVLEAHLGPRRARYEALMQQPAAMEEILMTGAAKARAIAQPFLAQLREAVGLRRMRAPVMSTRKTPESDKRSLPVFKQYREADGKFYFKLAAADGALLLQSAAFDAGRDAGVWVKRLKTAGVEVLDEAPVTLGAGVSRAEILAALDALNAAESEA